MRSAILLLVAGLVPSLALGEPKTKPSSAAPIEPPIAIPNSPVQPPTPSSSGDLKPTQSRLNEFQEDDLPLVLRVLARQAKMNVVVADNVRGTVTMRIEEKPREALNIVCKMKGLKITEQKGIYFITDPKAPEIPAPPASSSAASGFELASIVDGLLTPENISAATRIYDAMLDVQARPETAKKIAHARKLLLDALLEEGFTRDEAMKILLYSGKMELPDFKK